GCGGIPLPPHDPPCPAAAAAAVTPPRGRRANFCKGAMAQAATPAVPDSIAAATAGVTRAGRARSRHLLLVAAVALPLLIMAGAAWLSWRQAWREAETEMARAADAAAEYARRLLDGQLLRVEFADELLGGLSDAEIRAREAELHAQLRRASA